MVTLNLKISNENARPNIALDNPLNNDVIRGSESTAISGYVWDNDGIITRVDIDIYKNGRDSGSAPNTISITQNLIQSANLIHHGIKTPSGRLIIYHIIHNMK